MTGIGEDLGGQPRISPSCKHRGSRPRHGFDMRTWGGGHVEFEGRRGVSPAIVAGRMGRHTHAILSPACKTRSVLAANWRSDQARIDSSVMKKNSFTLWNSGSTQLWPLRKSKASNGRASIGLLLGVFSSNLDDWRVSPSASAPANLRREYQKHVDPGCASEAWLCHQMDPR